MFSGIVEAMGKVEKIEQKDEAVRFTVASREIAGRLTLGDSVCTSGVCLTVVTFDDETFSVEAIPETLRLTTLGDLQEGDRVNLELALTLQQGLGGHLVFGHIDGVGVRLEGPPAGYDAREAGEDEVIHWYSAPPSIMQYLVFKGSITISGVSLTVVDVADDALSVALIPHTLEVTTLGDIAVGDRVNLEADMIAKYVAEQLAPYLKHLKGVE
ncbi:riboflavin synthase [Gemmatimonadota bacterium]